MVFLCFIDYNINTQTEIIISFFHLTKVIFSHSGCWLQWNRFASIGLLGLASLGSISLMGFTYLMGLLY